MSGSLEAPEHVKRLINTLGTIMTHGWLGLTYLASMTLKREEGAITTTISVKADLAAGFPHNPHYLTLLNTENEKILNRSVQINKVSDEDDIFSITYKASAEDAPDGDWSTTFVYYLNTASEDSRKRWFAEVKAAEHIGHYLMTGILDGDPFP